LQVLAPDVDPVEAHFFALAELNAQLQTARLSMRLYKSILVGHEYVRSLPEKGAL